MHLPGAKRRNLGAKSRLSQAEVLTRIRKRRVPHLEGASTRSRGYFAICLLLFAIRHSPHA